MLLFPCTKIALISVSVYTCSADGVLRVYTIRKWAAHACRKNLWTPATISWWLFAHFRSRKRAASMGLRHACMNVSAGLNDAPATPFPYLAHVSVLYIKAGRIFVPALATGHHGHCSTSIVVVIIMWRMHANYDTEMVTCMRGLNDGETRFTSMNVIFKWL